MIEDMLSKLIFFIFILYYKIEGAVTVRCVYYPHSRSQAYNVTCADVCCTSYGTIRSAETACCTTVGWETTGIYM